MSKKKTGRKIAIAQGAPGSSQALEPRSPPPADVSLKEELLELNRTIESDMFALCRNNIESKRKASASNLAAKSAASDDPVTAQNLFFDHRVQSCAWPSLRVPLSFPKYNVFMQIIPLLTSYGFEFEPLPEYGCAEVTHDVYIAKVGGQNKGAVKQVTNTAHFCELSQETLGVWQRFCSEIAHEKLLRAELGLTELQHTPESRTEALRSLKVIHSLCADAAPASDQNEAEARRAWDTIAQCTRRIPCERTDIAVDYRLEREVYFPRNLLFDRIARVRDSDDRTLHHIVNEHFNVAKNSETLEWSASTTPDPTRAARTPESSVPSQWLQDTNKRLSKVMERQKEHLSPLAERWSASLKTPGYIDLKTRALRTFRNGICDLVIFVTARDVFSDDDVQKHRAQIEMLQVVGVRKAKRPESKGATAKDGDQNSTGEPTEQQSQDSAIPDRLEAPSRATSVQSVSSARQQETCKPVHETLQQVLRNILSNSGMHPSRTSPNAAESDATKLERDLHVVNPKHLLMPAVWQENKRPEEKFFQSFNQGRNYLLSSVRFYACLGMYNIEVFAVATVGHVGLLLFAWGEKPSETTKARVQSSSFTKLKGLQHTDVNIYIADVNCPQFEIAHEADAIRYRTFLTQLRDTQAQKIHDAFEKVREEFVSEWRKNPSARRFRWAARHQQAANATVVEPEITKLRQDLEANRDALKKLEKRKTELEALLQKSNDEKVTVA